MRSRPPLPAGAALAALLSLVLAITIAAQPALAASPAPAPPSLSAAAAILIEDSTGQVVYARDANQERAIASTTKLMTVLVTLERAKLSQVIVAPPYHPGPAESLLGLRTGEHMRVADLLRAALLPSANDAANALAIGIGGSRARFVRLMNARARSLGLTHTHYTTPVGLDDSGNYSSAADLARLALQVRRNAFARTVMAEPSAVLRSGARRRVVINRNDLVGRYPWINGVKTGHTTAAGYVLVGSATRGALSFMSVVLGTPSESARDADSVALLRYGFERLRRAKLLRRGQQVARRPVKDDPGHDVALLAARGVTRIISRRASVRLAIDAPRELAGPIPAGAVVGSVRVVVGGHTVARVPLTTKTTVPEISFLTKLGRFAGRGTTLAVLAAAVLIAALAGRRRQIVRRRRRRRQTRMGSAA